MGSLHFMAFFFIAIFHFSFAKDFLEQTDASDPGVIQFLSSKIKDATPSGTKDEEQTELVQIKEIKRQVIKGSIYTFDFEARGLKSNSLYDCKMVVSEQERIGVEEIKEYNCNIVPTKGNERLIPDEELSSDIENNFNPMNLKIGKKGKKYLVCMSKAAIRCLL